MEMNEIRIEGKKLISRKDLKALGFDCALLARKSDDRAADGNSFEQLSAWLREKGPKDAKEVIDYIADLIDEAGRTAEMNMSGQTENFCNMLEANLKRLNRRWTRVALSIKAHAAAAPEATPAAAAEAVLA